MGVVADDEGIRWEIADGEPWSIPWRELQRVEIETTDQGPFIDDVFWVLHSAAATLRVPQGADGEREMLERLQTLPGFDNDAVIAAMMSTETQSWGCWERPG